MEVLCGQCGQSLDASDVEPFALCECPVCKTDIIAPMSFGRFVLRKHLGKKSVFNVYEGLDIEKKTDCTVFVLDKSVPDYGNVLKTVREEAAFAERIKHQHISPLLLDGEIDGCYFAAEPLMDGYEVSNYDPVAQGLLNIDEVIQIIHDIAMGLATAHHRSLCHHDIAPENVQIDARGNVRVKNLLLSRVRYVLEEKARVLASVSPYYMSPEKAESFSEDKPGDVFSLGVLFYYMLTGKRPFEGKNDTETIFSRIRHIKKKEEEPETDVFSASDYNSTGPVSPESVHYVPPANPSKHRPEIHEALSGVIMRMLNYSPQTRPTIPQFLDVLSMYFALKDKETGISAAQKRMVLTKTIMVTPNRKNKGILGFLKF